MNLDQVRKTWLLVLGAVLLGFAPLLIPFFRGQWARSEYQAFPLLIAAIGFFLWLRWSSAPTVNREHWSWLLLGWLATLAAFVNLGLAMFFYSPWLAIVSFVFFAFSFALNVWQRWDVRGIFMIWLLISLLVPPPLDRDRIFVSKLQLFSSEMTSRILDGLGILHVLRGNIFDLPKKQLGVDEACSGIVSLVSILTCIAIYVVWKRRSLFHFVLLVFFGMAWTIFMNTIRLATIAIAWSWYEFDLSEGQPHLLLGLVIFLLSAGVVYCVDRLLAELLAPIEVEWRERDASTDKTGLSLMKFWNTAVASPRENEDEETFTRSNKNPKLQNHEVKRVQMLSPASPVGWPVLGILALAGLAQIALVAPSEAKLQAAIRSAKSRAIELNKEFDPLAGQGLRLVEFRPDERKKFDAWGEFSRSFEYEDADGNRYWISVDFPFGPHWHDLRDCYYGAGWKIIDETYFVMDVVLDESAAPRLGTGSITAGWEADEFLTIRTNQPETSLVLHSAFYADGKIFNRPRAGNLYYDFVTHVAKGRDRQEQADYFQVQVVARSPKMISAAQRETARKLIGIVSEKFRLYLTQNKE
jgi:exosortase